MNIILRIPRNLYKIILDDLNRRHEFAVERVGFVFGKIGNKEQENEIIILNKYLPVNDDNYEKNEFVGASINSSAIRYVMQHAMDDAACVFHVHVHYGAGCPSLSRTDIKGIIPMLPSFQVVSPKAKHGILLFNNTNASAWIWLDDKKSLLRVKKISIVGFPIKLFF